MTDIQEALAGILERGSFATAQMKALGARIRAGESSGDTILDFLIAYGGSYLLRGTHGPIEQAYRDLAERLTGKTGQLVLMIERVAVIDLRDSTGRTNLLLEKCTLGLLKDDRIAFDFTGTKPYWAFPTDRFAERGT